jgi:hypothetical protein
VLGTLQPSAGSGKSGAEGHRRFREGDRAFDRYHQHGAIHFAENGGTCGRAQTLWSFPISHDGSQPSGVWVVTHFENTSRVIMGVLEEWTSESV